VGVKNPEYEGVLEVDEGEFFVRCMMENRENSFKWNLITIYVLLNCQERRGFAHRCSRIRFPSLFGGDYNLINT
jgi:hypothetical protein